MRVALDTNILAYAEGANGGSRQSATRAIIRRLAGDSRVIPAQALGELYNVLVRKLEWPRERARTAIAMWRNGIQIAPTTTAAMIAAIDLAADHRLSIWDSVMLAVAAEGGCELLLSEDFQDGFTWGGVTVVNPFAATRHPLLDAVLGAI
jgi:predicted nucleic acid-binding protein